MRKAALDKANHTLVELPSAINIKSARVELHVSDLNPNSLMNDMQYYGTTVVDSPLTMSMRFLPQNIQLILEHGTMTVYKLFLGILLGSKC